MGDQQEAREARVCAYVSVCVCPCNQSALAHAQNSVRLCEYDEDTAEYWVNTRTSGTLSREDVETMSRERTHDQTVGADSFALGDGPEDTEGVGGFNADLGASGMDLEGDSQVTVSMHLNFELAYVI